MGKALTYSEKYFILKFFNIATDNDDPDAHETVTTSTSRPVQQPARPTQATGPAVATKTAPGTASVKQVNMINTLCTSLGVDRDKYKEKLGVKSMNDLSSTRASQVIEALLEKQKQKELAGKPELPTVDYGDEGGVDEIPD